MTSNERKLSDLRDSLEGTMASSIRRFIAATMSSIPIVGGAINAVSGAVDDYENMKQTENILSLLKDHDDKIDCIWNAVFGNEPTREKLRYLFNEILGEDIPEKYSYEKDFPYILNPFSREEFRVYENLGWLKITGPCGSVGNFTCKVGSFSKYERKRTDGPGAGYILHVTELFYRGANKS